MNRKVLCGHRQIICFRCCALAKFVLSSLLIFALGRVSPCKGDSRNFAVPDIAGGWGEPVRATFWIVVNNPSDHARLAVTHVRKSPAYGLSTYGSHFLAEVDKTEWQRRRSGAIHTVATFAIRECELHHPVQRFWGTICMCVWCCVCVCVCVCVCNDMCRVRTCGYVHVQLLTRN